MAGMLVAVPHSGYKLAKALIHVVNDSLMRVGLDPCRALQVIYLTDKISQLQGKLARSK
jgi:hypothetical protein